jgi:hypothetical protein
MYQLVNRASSNVTFNVQSASPTFNSPATYGQNKDVLYISLFFIMLILIVGLWLLYSHYMKDKKQNFGYSM